MLRSKLDVALGQLAGIKKIVENGGRLREYVPPYGFEDALSPLSTVDVSYSRTFDYCASITRAYATFERFILDAAEQFAIWRVAADRTAFLSSAKTVAAYEMGVAEIFRRYGEARFAVLDKAQIAHSLAIFHGVAQGESKFVAAPFFATLPNLRISHIDQLLQVLDCEETLSGWLSSSQEASDFCDETGLSILEEVKDLVERRNDVAHGNELPLDIWGPGDIAVRIDMLILLCLKFYELIIYVAICCSQRLWGARSVGQVNTVWRSANAFELKTNGRLVCQDSKVVFFKSGSVLVNAIKGLQLEGLNCKAYYGPIETMLGVSLSGSQLPKKRMTVIQIADYPDLGRLVGS
jgi:hypothetical protein